MKCVIITSILSILKTALFSSPDSFKKQRFVLKVFYVIRSCTNLYTGIFSTADMMWVPCLFFNLVFNCLETLFGQDMFW